MSRLCAFSSRASPTASRLCVARHTSASGWVGRRAGGSEDHHGAEPVITLTINGGRHTVDAPPDMPLLWVLRDLLGMTGTKFGCGAALCGACTGNLDGIPRRSCVTPVSAAVRHAITPIQGIGATSLGKRVQPAW